MAFIAPLLIILAGAWAIFATLTENALFFQHRKARFIVGILGQPAARVFYLVIGGALVVGGGAWLLSRL